MVLLSWNLKRIFKKVNSISFRLFEPLLKWVTWRRLAAYPQLSQPEMPHSNAGDDRDVPACHPVEYLQNLSGRNLARTSLIYVPWHTTEKCPLKNFLRNNAVVKGLSASIWQQSVLLSPRPIMEGFASIGVVKNPSHKKWWGSPLLKNSAHRAIARGHQMCSKFKTISR